MATHLENTGLMIFFLFPSKDIYSTWVFSFFAILPLESKASFLQVCGLQTWPSCRLKLELKLTLTSWHGDALIQERRDLFFSSSLPCSQVHECQPGPWPLCSFSRQSSLLSELDSDRASLSSKFPVFSWICETWQGSGVRCSEFEAICLVRIPALPGTWNGTLDTCRLSDP